MTKRDWWLGVATLAIALLLHAALPRHEWLRVNDTLFVRLDRWTGHVSVGSLTRDGNASRRTSSSVRAADSSAFSMALPSACCRIAASA